jgi:hypothetical protein
MERSYLIVSVPKVAKGAKDVKVCGCLFFQRAPHTCHVRAAREMPF